MRFIDKTVWSILTLSLAAVLAPSSICFATTVNLTGTGFGTFTSTSFSYDGGASNYNSASGTDNLGGHSTSQGVSEYSGIGTSCTSQDGSAGIVVDLLQANSVTNYDEGQLYMVATGSTAGRLCASLTSGLVGGRVIFTVTGGTGKFRGAGGSITETFTGQTLVTGANNTSFGSLQVRSEGAVTF